GNPDSNDDTNDDVASGDDGSGGSDDAADDKTGSGSSPAPSGDNADAATGGTSGDDATDDNASSGDDADSGSSDGAGTPATGDETADGGSGTDDDGVANEPTDGSTSDDAGSDDATGTPTDDSSADDGSADDSASDGASNDSGSVDSGTTDGDTSTGDTTDGDNSTEDGGDATDGSTDDGGSTGDSTTGDDTSDGGTIIGGDDSSDTGSDDDTTTDPGGSVDTGIPAREVPTLIPGPGWDGPTAEPGPVGSTWKAGYDAKAIARWDVVPGQAITGVFEIGVVAFHMNGIERVEFSVDNGPWVEVREMTENPRTGVKEYWVKLDPTLFQEDGEVEVRAIAYPWTGEPRLLAGGDVTAANGEHSMFLWANAFDTLPKGKTVEIGPETAIVEALIEVGDGGTVILKEAGTYQFHPDDAPNGWWHKNKVPRGGRREIIKAADGLDVHDVVVTQGPELMRVYCELHWIGVSFDNGRISQYHSGNAVFDRCRWYDSDGWTNEHLVPVQEHYWAIDSIAEDKLYAFPHAILVRGATVRRISGDVFQNSNMVLDCDVDVVDGTVLGHHTDLYQMFGEMDNLIVYDVRAQNLNVLQSLFLEPTFYSDPSKPQHKLQNAAFVNFDIINTPKARKGVENHGGPPYSQLISQFEHVLFRHVRLPNQRLIIRTDKVAPDNQAFQAKNVFFENCELHWATYETYVQNSGAPEGVEFKTCSLGMSGGSVD
ncbi:MAG: hypothetical protein ACLFVH_10560, partial [Phycisphaerae bacterium]